MIANVPTDVAPPGQESVYRTIWNYHLWGYSKDDIYDILQASGESVSRDEVRDAIQAMTSHLDSLDYGEMGENEFRLYLARNYQAEQELIELYIQAKNDLNLLRNGQTRRADGGRIMPVDFKTLMSLLAAIEKQGQSRASLLARINQERARAVALQQGQAKGLLEDSETDSDEERGVDAKALLESLVRRPEDIIDAEFKPAEIEK